MPTEEILAGPSIAHWRNPPLMYYADRNCRRVEDIKTFTVLQAKARFRFFILSKRDADKILVDYVTPRFFTEEIAKGYLLVDLKKPL